MERKPHMGQCASRDTPACRWRAGLRPSREVLTVHTLGDPLDDLVNGGPPGRCVGNPQGVLQIFVQVLRHAEFTVENSAAPYSLSVGAVERLDLDVGGERRPVEDVRFTERGQVMAQLGRRVPGQAVCGVSTAAAAAWLSVDSSAGQVLPRIATGSDSFLCMPAGDRQA
ncbi:hypothetical protein [Streptomyces xantholiticus]|uniref:Uncharacterized protein n=1 Tax=Streptomyces xantholiticus TaxID=68285 RepID=A0ABV1V4T6_9ACTN